VQGVGQDESPGVSPRWRSAGSQTTSRQTGRRGPPGPEFYPLTGTPAGPGQGGRLAPELDAPGVIGPPLGARERRLPGYLSGLADLSAN
jgi:hypothetical protein